MILHICCEWCASSIPGMCSWKKRTCCWLCSRKQKGNGFRCLVLKELRRLVWCSADISTFTVGIVSYFCCINLSSGFNRATQDAWFVLTGFCMSLCFPHPRLSAPCSGWKRWWVRGRQRCVCCRQGRKKADQEPGGGTYLDMSTGEGICNISWHIYSVMYEMSNS